MTRQGLSSSLSERGCNLRRYAGRFPAFMASLGLCLNLMLNGAAADAQQSAVSGSDTSEPVYSGATDMSVARIGLIDLDGVLRASTGAARVRELLDEQRREFQREFAAREAALQEAERKLVAQREVLDEAEFARQLAEFEASVTQIQKEIQYRREAIDVAFQDAQSRLRDLAIQIVTDLAQEKKLDLVLVRESALIFLPSLNLSDEVLRRLDERTKNARIEVTVSPVGTDQ
ncbi:MAG: OmpH family outer membrane protein [Alphaproteobacteria bacterium]|nr:OmpH family outer membrane protein [Alphaproteobacteria bacterium]